MFIPPETLFTWDFWTITDKSGLHHAFFLQAPRNRHNPESRHNMAEVGHAVSRDLKNWEYCGTVIKRGAPGAWNDIAIWTGSVFETRLGEYAMLLTGRTSKDGADEQRLGLFFSHDLHTWREYEFNPVVSCDFSIYEKHHHIELSTTWRDPHVVIDPADSTYKAFLTAQRKNKDGQTAGCIAIAQSSNLTEWKVLPPARTPDYFRVMECPQVVPLADGRHAMLIHIDQKWVMPHAPAGVPRVTGSHALIADSLMGEYRYAGLLLDGGIDTERGHVWAKYQLRAHDRDASGKFRALYWNGYRKDCSFAGGLSDPEVLDLAALRGS
jgi:beta-fructofuranosidase